MILISAKQARVHLLEREPFENAFGPKMKRKRPRLLAADYESLIQKAGGSQGNQFSCHKDFFFQTRIKVYLFFWGFEIIFGYVQMRMS